MTLRFWFQNFCLAIAIIFILVLSQPITSGNSTSNPLSPPPTASPRETLSAFLKNMDTAYDLVTSTYEAGKTEAGLFYSPRLKKQAALAEEAMERAIDTLNLSLVPPSQSGDIGVESVLILKEIFDRLAMPSLNKVPDLSTVEQEGLTRWNFPDTKITIGLVDAGLNEGSFLFTPDTVQKLRVYYEEIKSFPYHDHRHITPNFYDFYISTPGSIVPPKWTKYIPQWSNFLIYDQTLWQWVSFLVIYCGMFVLIIRGFRFIKIYTKQSKGHPIFLAWLGLWLPSFSLISIAVIDNFIDNFINLTGKFLFILKTFDTVIVFIIGSWIAFLCMNAIGVTILNDKHFHAKPLETIMMRNGFRLLGIFAGAIVATFGCQTLGISVTPLLASLGAGSLALSFGLRSYVEDVIGGITLFVNGTMKVGDYCEFGGVAGMVEDIGLRATVLRTKDRKLITVPNAGVSSTLVNHSRRDKFIFERLIILSEDFLRSELSTLMNNLCQRLAEFTVVTSPRVSLVAFEQQRISIEVFGYVNIVEFTAFLAVQGKLLLAIADELDKMGVQGDILPIVSEQESSTSAFVRSEGIEEE